MFPPHPPPTQQNPAVRLQVVHPTHGPQLSNGGRVGGHTQHPPGAGRGAGCHEDQDLPDQERHPEREGGRTAVGGGPGWLCSSGGSSTSQRASSAEPLTHCGSLGPAGTPRVLGPPGVPSDMEPSRIGSGAVAPLPLLTTAPMGSESQVGDAAPPEGLTCIRRPLVVSGEEQCSEGTARASPQPVGSVGTVWWSEMGWIPRRLMTRDSSCRGGYSGAGVLHGPPRPALLHHKSWGTGEPRTGVNSGLSVWPGQSVPRTVEPCPLLDLSRPCPWDGGFRRAADGGEKGRFSLPGPGGASRPAQAPHSQGT